MIIFLFGPDTFRSSQKLNKIIGDYKKIHKSGLNFLTLDFKESDFKNFKKNLESSSIFREKKMIILKHLFSEEGMAKPLLDYLENSKLFADQEKIIIIYEKEIPYNDKEFKGAKKDLFNKLTKLAKFQEFKELNISQLKNWIKKELEAKNTQISQKALEKLIFYVGNDLWQMSNEIKKAVLFKAQNREDGKRIEEQDIDLLVRPKIETNIFKTIEAIANKNKKLALKLVQEHCREGESENYILSMILWQIRNLVKIKSLGETMNALSDEKIKKLAKKTGLHPYVAEKTLGQARKFTISELKKIYHKLLEVDYKIKTGRIKAKTALDLFIAEIC